MAARMSRRGSDSEVPGGLCERSSNATSNEAGSATSQHGSASCNQSSSPHHQKDRLKSQLYGAAVLLVTTVLWASGGPTTKYLFLLPAPPSAALLTACISVITALFLVVGLLGSAMEGGLGTSDPAPDPENAADRDLNVHGDLKHAYEDGVDERRLLLPHHASDPAQVEAEVLLHSSIRAMGGLGGAGAASVGAARWAAQEQQLACRALLEAEGGARREAWARPSNDGARDEANGTTSAAAGALSALVVAALGSGGTLSGNSGGQAHAGSGAAASGASGLAVQRHLDSETAAGPGGHPSLDGISSPPRPAARPAPSCEKEGLLNSAARPFTAPQGANGGGAVLHGSTSAVAAAHPHNRQLHRRCGAGADLGPAPFQAHIRLLTAPARSLIAAGLELGLYNTMAAALGAWGMQRISATRAAFLAQATSLITPLLVWLSGGRVGLVVWLACCCGALGGAMVALDNVYGIASHGGHDGTDSDLPRRVLDGVQAGGAAALQGSGGDQAVLAATSEGTGTSSTLSPQAVGAIYVLLSCVFWGLGTVRLGVHSARFQSLKLAAAAAVSYAALALGWLLLDGIVLPRQGKADFLELGVLLHNPMAAALLLWAGLGPGALSSYLQVVGQQTVPPAQAQVLFSSTPLWSALIAQLLLPGEAMGVLAWTGGAVMLGASLMASVLQ